eukprot:CAMPEP_0183730440 /NCGR_PEP_ID=MMETSP0737-20130205/32827_1 /TAXON_ID=385413 /ORGANISM="Thalassiosira miniscula, Strain CCMP1093" /LENGTH=688 /DNA_ID=CAMNT_0025962941 /DNA_START=312 /DNA_END=2378 /DNA_ORIENTATION=-
MPPLCASDDSDDEPEKLNEKGKPSNSFEDDRSGKNNASDRTGSSRKDEDNKSKPNILNMINPFNAGKSLRSTVESAIDLASAITNEPASRLSPDRRSIYYNYYVDDQLGLSSLELKDDPKYDSSITTSSSLFNSPDDEDYRPEVLVVGASGALGRVLVKRLLLENKVRVRVLVRDLYSSTLNKLGTGVTYCQGSLNDMESLEYAVTDVDKIVFCAGGKRLQEGNEQNALESVLDQRSKEAAEIDGVGLRNLLHAYLNVRHADYGTSQAAKRVLFKFRKRPADFDLFGIDDGSVDGSANDLDADGTLNDSEDDKGGENGQPSLTTRPSYGVAATLSQCDWKRNKFGHGVFVGKVGRGGEAAIASARLRSRNDPEQGIDLRSGGFAGLVCRVCSDGAVYEAFVRTESYERLGVEYVCEFKTSSKSPADGSENTSRTKWSTVRLEFSDFRPRMRQFQAQEGEDAQRMRQALGQSEIPPFTGRDIRQLGFRYRAKNNPFSWSGASNFGWSNFYLALDFIKVYRGQPEPEFVYLSDARIPPVVNDAMVKHDLHRLVTSSIPESSTSYSIIDDKEATKVMEDKMDRSAEETYFKYMGEEMIKQSGLSYTIIRVAGYNADLGTDSSAVRLQKMNKNITAVSRVDLAQVIASALLTPNACNLILYMTKAQQRGVLDGDIWQKFARLRLENEPAPFQ